MSEETESVSALQAREYLKLFREEGKSPVGLFLFEIGWVVLLVLAAKLAGGGSEGAGEHAKAAPTLWSIPFLYIWAIGVPLIYLTWLSYSGHFGKFLAIGSRPLRFLSHLLFTILVIVTGIVDGLLALILMPFKKIAMPTWREEHRRDWIEKTQRENRGKGTEDQASEAYERWVADFKKKNGERAFDNLILEEKHFDRFSPWRIWQALGKHVLTGMQSRVRIGIAPPVIHTRGSGQRVQPDPLPGLLRAYANAQGRAKWLRVMEHVRRTILSPAFPISAPLEARREAQLRNLDCLIWCNLATTEPGVVHLFLEAAQADGADESEDDKSGLVYQRGLFGDRIKELRLDPPSFALGADDAAGAYVALIMAIMLALCTRRPQSSFTWLRSWDKTSQFREQRVNELMEHLAYELLPHLVSDETKSAAMPSVRKQAAELIGSWVGMQMRADFTTKDIWQQLGEKRHAEQLSRILHQCLQLAPNSPDNWFRMGALACYQGDEVRALEAFHRAAEQAPGHPNIKRIGALVQFELALKMEAKTGIGLEEQLAWGRAAAYAACALAVGDDWEVTDIRKQLASEWVFLARHAGRTVAIDVIEKLLAEKSDTAVGPPDEAAK